MYSQFEVQRGVPIRHLLKYFQQAGDRWVLKDDIRKLVTFQRLNLLDDVSAMGQCDVIFCRNVAIYFDKPTQGEVFGRFGKMLAPDGFLYIGHSENLGSGGDGFRLVGKTIYQSTEKLNRRAA